MRASTVAIVLCVVTAATSVHAQVRGRFPQSRTVSISNSGDDDDDDTPVQQEVIEETTTNPLRARFGPDHAVELVRAAESEDVRRGIARAAASGSTEAVNLLVAQVDSSNDDLTLIELARALAPFAKQESARQKLIQLLNASARSRARGSVLTAASVARVDLARQIAARALVASRDPKALEAIQAAAREGGTGQQNALRALASDPFASPVANEGVVAPPSSASVARALAQTGDLRVLDALLAKAPGGADASVREACLVALGQLGDGRARPIAIAAFADSDPHVRAAAGESLVLLDAPERFHAVTQLISSDDTVRAGVRLAHRAQDGEVVKALAARFAATTDASLRLEILAALGRGVATDDALKVLASVAADPKLGGDAVHAIARSPNPHATATLEQLARQQGLRRLAVRGYVVRVLLRGEHSSSLDDVVASLRASNDSADRALAAFTRVALAQDHAAEWLADRDAAVRRAAAIASLASYDGRTLPAANALLRRYVQEPDEATRAVLAIGLVDGDLHAIVPTRSLVERIEAGGADAALSVTALAARKGDSIKAKLEPFETSSDPLLRAHLARGLGASEEPSATGRLAEASRYEAEPLVRLAQMQALAKRSTAPSRNEMLSITARFDPEARIREVATRGLTDAPPPSPWPLREVAWLRVATDSGAPPRDLMLASYVTSEGVAIPIAFDADGYALVPGAPPGDGRLILSPTLPK